MNVNFYEILERFGTTKDLFRTIFTSLPDELTADVNVEFEKRKKKYKDDPDFNEETLKQATIDEFYNRRTVWQRRIQNRIEEGRAWSLRNYRFYMVCDIAWDSMPNTPENIPLQLYAQGRININQCYDRVKNCVNESITEEELNKMFIKDPDNPSQIKSLNLPRLHEVSVNLARSMVRRRVAAQANKYNDLYPYYQYESRPKDMVSKLRADVASQRVESITDQYGYRSDFTQDLRKNFLYSHAVSFVEKAWDREKQYRMIPSPAGDEETSVLGESRDELEEYIVKEGIPFISPHPTRVFYDRQYPLASINTDTGCTYLGYWDIVRWRNIGDNPKFFNRSAVKFSSDHHFTTYSHYFDYYYNCGQCTIKFPQVPQEDDIEEGNRRDSRMDIYASGQGDESVWVTNYYEKVIPREVGLGDYPFPVWVRLVVASDTTVVYGEILPSKPASYMGHDEDHSKMLNVSMVHEIIPYNDQISNLFSQATYLMKIQSILVMAVDTDILNNDQIEHIRQIAEGTEYYSKMLMVEHSASDDEETFDKPIDNRQPISLVQTQAQLGDIISSLLSNVGTIIQLLEKAQMMSPQEAGTFAQGERVTAQEVNEVSQTTNSLFAYISEGPDQYRASKKRIIFESLLALGDEDIKVYVQERYPDEVIESAGFSPRLGSDAEGYALSDREKQAITGQLKSLAFEVMYNSRDGSERAISTESAKVLADLTRYIFSTPDIFQIFVDNFGIEQFAQIISEVFRLSGAGFILKLPPTAESRQAQIAQLLSQMQDALEKSMDEQGKTNEDLAEQITTMQGNIDTLTTQLGIESLPPPPPTPVVVAPAGTGGAPEGEIVTPPPERTPETVLTTQAP
jgi:hypothetical protein